MKRYIKLYDNVISKQDCEEIISLFDSNPDQHEEHNNDLMNFKQINMIQHRDTWSKQIDILSSAFLKGLEQYKYECRIETGVQWPENFSFEEFRIKRYEPGQGVFNLHTDVNDYNSAIRFLVFFVYLNSGSDGGTDFPTLGVTAPRKQGSMIMFPPLWTYPHAGLMPLKAPKYIVGSYLHYLKDEHESI